MPDKLPYNKKGTPNGYWETNWFKGNYVNGELCGLCEVAVGRYGEINSKQYYAR